MGAADKTRQSYLSALAFGRTTMPITSAPLRRPGRRGLASRTIPVLVLGALVLTGCEESRYGMPEPVSADGEAILGLWRVSFYAAVALGLLVLGLLLYSAIRHRRRSDDLPKQTEGNIALEITYTLIPFVLVGLLFAYGMQVQSKVTHLSDQPDVTIDVSAFQWNWQFDYPGQDVSITGGRQEATDSGDELPTFYVPVDQRVRFRLIAADVAHSFFVPGFLTKRDVIPGVRNEIEVTPTKVGTFMGHCAEFCGLNHSAMNFRVRVVPQAEYQSWLQQEKGRATVS